MLSFTSYDAYMVMYDVSEPKTETYALEVNFLILSRFVLFLAGGICKDYFVLTWRIQTNNFQKSIIDT